MVMDFKNLHLFNKKRLNLLLWVRIEYAKHRVEQVI